MKSFADLRKYQQKEASTVYLKDSNDKYTIIKYYKRKGNKAIIVGPDFPNGTQKTVSQNDIYPHPYFPDRRPIAVELQYIVMGNKPGTIIRFTDDDIATIKSKWHEGGSNMLLHHDMMYANPDLFKPIYVL